MKHNTNYTTKDWCTEFAYMFCFVVIAQYAFREFAFNHEIIDGLILSAGAAGWAILYYKHRQEINKRNE